MNKEESKKLNQTNFGEEYWLYHLKQSQKYNGTEKAYCLENNIKRSSFAGAKHRYKNLTLSSNTEPKEDSKQMQSLFKKVQITDEKLEEGKAYNLSSLSPEWTARFLKELFK